MKKTFALILILATLTTICAGALAECFVYVYVDTSIHTGPGYIYPIQSNVSADTILSWWGDIVDDSFGNEWYEVECGGRLGWISGQYSDVTNTLPW